MKLPVRVRACGAALRAICVFGVALLLAPSAPAQPESAPEAAAARPAHSPEECAVWRRELSFARSVENHDTAAFVSHVHPGAVFQAGSAEPVRGRDAVLAAWAPLIEGKGALLRWRPGVVNIGGDANVALSRGPFVFESTGRDGARRRSVGFFHSVWVRESSAGDWRILFDGPDGAPTGVETDAAARQFLAAQSAAECPLK